MTFILLGRKGKKSFTEMAFELLTEEWPLSIRGMRYRMRKRFKRTATTQAIFKIMKKLENEGVLTKKAHRYRINPKWLETIKKTAQELSEKYAKEKVRLKDIP